MDSVHKIGKIGYPKLELEQTGYASKFIIRKLAYRDNYQNLIYV